MQLSLLSSSSSSSSSSDFHHFSPQRFLQHRIDYLPQHWNSILADFCQAGSIISAISYEESASCPSESNIFSVYTNIDWETSQVFTSATYLQTSSSPCFSMKSVALVKKKKNRWKKDLMLARRAELWEWGARKVETHTFMRLTPKVPHDAPTSISSLFFFFFLTLLTCRTGLAEKQGLLIV